MNFSFFDNVIRIILQVPSIRIILSIGSINGKIRLSEVHPRFLSNVPFVNLQIKSMVESLRPIQSCTQKIKKRFKFLKNMHFGVKNHSSEILKFLQISCSDLVGAIGVLEAVDM